MKIATKAFLFGVALILGCANPSRTPVGVDPTPPTRRYGAPPSASASPPSSSRWNVGQLEMKNLSFRAVPPDAASTHGFKATGLTLLNIPAGSDVQQFVQRPTPGSSVAAKSPLVLARIWAGILVFAELNAKNCAAVTVTDTKVLREPSNLDPNTAERAKWGGQWIEQWTVDHCSKSATYLVKLYRYRGATVMRMSDSAFPDTDVSPEQQDMVEKLQSKGWTVQQGKDGFQVASPFGWFGREGRDGRHVAGPSSWSSQEGKDGRVIYRPFSWTQQEGRDGRLVALPFGWRGEEGKDGRLVPVPPAARTEEGRDGRLVALPFDWQTVEDENGRLWIQPRGGSPERFHPAFVDELKKALSPEDFENYLLFISTYGD